jgi:hypothetical protein
VVENMSGASLVDIKQPGVVAIVVIQFSPLQLLRFEVGNSILIVLLYIND